MNITNQKKCIFKIMNWLMIVFFTFINVIMFYIYKKITYFLFIALITLIISIILQEVSIKNIKKKINFLNEINLERKQIIWSNKKEALQITVIIFISTTIISLVLWGLDRSIFYIISSIIKLRF